MRKAENIQQKETVDLLNKCWMTHDGMWFFHCLQELGIEATNKINKSAIKSLSSIEIARVRKTLDCINPIEDFDEFKDYDLLMDLQQDVADWKDAINDKKDLIWELEDEEISFYVT